MTTSFALKRIGSELIFYWDKAGTTPWVDVPHQGMLTPLQKQTLAYGQEYRNEKQQEMMDDAGEGEAPARPRNGMAGGNSATDMKKQAVAGQYGAGNATYVNADWDEDKPLIVGDDGDQ